MQIEFFLILWFIFILLFTKICLMEYRYIKRIEQEISNEITIIGVNTNGQ